MFQYQNNSGFTLIETVIYVSVLSILVAVLSGLTLNLLTNYRLTKSKEALAVAADRVWGTFFQEVRNADLIYLPTTVLTSDYGELSLRTSFQPTDNTEPETYTDIYRADNRVWFKKEGGTAQALTGSDVEVTKFKLLRSSGAGGLEGLRLYLDLKSKDYPSQTFSLTTFAMVRGGYVK